MSEPKISAEFVRQLCDRPSANAIDYRGPRLPGFVLRARTSGVHSWRVQLASRRWLTLDRLEEVSLARARLRRRGDGRADNAGEIQPAGCARVTYVGANFDMMEIALHGVPLGSPHH